MNKEDFLNFISTIQFDKVQFFNIELNKEGKTININNSSRDRF